MSVLFRSKCKYNPDFCDLIIEHCREGHTFESFSGRIGVHPSTVYQWKVQHEEFSQACEIGLRAALFYWEKVHSRAATGESKGNAAAIIFKLKNTFKEWYKDRQEIEHSSYAQISVSTGIDKSIKLPDVDTTDYRIIEQAKTDHVNKILKSPQYVDFEDLQNMVLENPQDSSEDDIL